MKLVLKEKEGKTPFIGVSFQSESEGARLNQMYVNSYGNDLYKIELELFGGSLLLKLYSSAKLICSYPGLIFDHLALYKFLYENRNVKLFKFGHVQIIQNQITLIRTSVNQTPYILKVNDLVLKRA